MQMKNISKSSQLVIMNSSSSPSSLHGMDHHHHHHESSSNDEFLQQFLISSCTWSPPPDSPEDTDPHPHPHPSFHHFDESSSSFMTTSKQHHQQQQQQMILMSPSSNASIDSSSLVPLPLSLNVSDLLETSHTNNNFNHDLMIDGTSFVNGFTAGSLNPSFSTAAAAPGAHHLSNPNQHFQHPNFGANNINGLGVPANGTTTGGGQPSQQPRQRTRAKRGEATDSHSIAERLRREKIAVRMKALREVVPNANKTDKASMLDEIIDYVKFLQLQVKVLSMSRLGGAPRVSPLAPSAQREWGTNNTSTNDNNVTVTEQQVAKLMEEDMGSAMQYLQGKGLCLMPISLATAISTATSHSRPHFPNKNRSNGESPSSPKISALTVQSSGANNASVDGPNIIVKDTNSISKP